MDMRFWFRSVSYTHLDVYKRQEWKQFRLPSWGVIVKSMKNCVVVDGRNIYDSDELEQLGIQYYCIGK